MKKILVIQQKMIGDVLLTSILCEYLKTKYPQSEIHYCIHSNTIPVIVHNPFIDVVENFTEECRKSKRAFWKFLMHIRSQKFDWVIDAYGKPESNLISLFSGAKSRISFDKWYTRLCYTQTVKRSAYVYTHAGRALEDRLRLVCAEDQIKDNIIAPKIFISEKEREAGRKLLAEGGIDLKRPLIMMSILGSASDKSLPASTMSQLIDEIVLTTQAQILFNYIPNQLPQAQEICEGTQAIVQKSIYFEVYGKGLREFITLLSHCNALIGNEGGAVNMAKALDIPTFTIFSPWIKKDSWNMFEDGIKHDSVHLADFEPEIYKDAIYKDLKPQAQELYKKITMDRMMPKLNTFLKHHF